MQDKDRVIRATDNIGEALKVLCRINYDNANQAERNIRMASLMLHNAAKVLEIPNGKEG